MNNNKPYIDLGVKWGLIMGLGLGIFANLFAFISMDLLFKPFFSSAIAIINFAAFIILMVIVGKKARAFTGFITVNQAFTTLMIMALVHVGTSSVLSYGTNMATKEKKEAKVAEVKQKMIDDMEAKGMDDEQIEKSLAMVDKFSSNSPTMLILGLIARIIVDLAVAFIIASTIKRLPVTLPGEEAETT